jgi:hypothetical protein
MRAVEVDRVGVRSGVGEVDSKQITLRASESGARNAPVVRPGRKPDARGHFDLPIHGDDLVLPDRASGPVAGNVTVVEVEEERLGIETVRGSVIPENAHPQLGQLGR